ncbi:MAG TPA: hypothetical protein VGM98_17870 [Schlesneria sp.]
MTNVPADQISSKREERWFAARLLFLFIVVIAGFFGLISLRGNGSSSKYPRVKLPDGSWLVARQVTVGKIHAIEIPYSLGEQFRRWQQSYKQPYMTSDDRTVIWLMRENDRGERLDLDWVKRVEIDVGDPRPMTPQQYHRQNVQANSSGGTGTGSTGFSDAQPFAAATPMEIALIHFDFPLLRPRDNKLIVKVFDGGDTLIAELPLPYIPPPSLSTDEWEPDPLPASRTDGNLTVTLNSVDFFEASEKNGVYVSPRLTYEHDGVVSTTWGASEVFHDLLGNQSYAWNCDLSPAETAWKMKLRMMQNANGRFLPEETKKLPLRPLAPAQQLEMATETHQINGLTVSIVGLGGTGPLDVTLPKSNLRIKTGKYQPEQYGSGMTSSCNNNRCEVDFSSGLPFLMTSNGMSQSDTSLAIVFRDQDGVILPQNGNSGAQGFSFWFFDPKPTSTSVEIEIIVQKYRQAEFLIAPPKPDEIKKRQ